MVPRRIRKLTALTATKPANSLVRSCVSRMMSSFMAQACSQLKRRARRRRACRMRESERITRTRIPPLQRIIIGLAGADAQRVLQVDDENLAVTNLAGFRCRGDGFHHGFDLTFRYRYFQLRFRQEAHGIFGAAIDLRVSLLPSIALDLGDGHAVDAETGERVAHLVELERFDDCDDKLHATGPVFRSPNRAVLFFARRRPRPPSRHDIRPAKKN